MDASQGRRLGGVEAAHCEPGTSDEEGEQDYELG